ncbi:MAG: ATP-dependent DNA helicase [Candidatus Micrarchaeaceae archaeon]
MQFLFRFENPRKHQKEMIEDIYDSLEKRQSIILNAPTGIGKTDASISAALTFALKNNLNVFFLTPKISQHNIVIESLKGINKKFNLNLNYVDIVGKRNLCVNEKVNYIEGESFYKSCENLVKAKKCPFYTKSKEKGEIENLSQKVKDGHNTFFNACFEAGVCGYEATADIAKNARFIIADYAHFLNPYTKKTFLKRIGHTLENSIIIWDEAHNIINSASSYMNRSMSTYTLGMAEKELKTINSEIDISYMRFIMEKISDQKLKQKNINEVFFSGNETYELLTSNISNVSNELEKAALEYLTKSGSKRSYTLQISRFLEYLKDSDNSTAKILSKKGEDIKLSIISLYPGEALEPLNEAYSNIFMSGTMLPLYMYKELLGVKNAKTSNYQSPFSSSNKLCIIDDDVSTKYENRSILQYKQIAAKITNIKTNTYGNIVAFFPSFDMLKNVNKYMGITVDFIQRSEMKSPAVQELIRNFKESENSIMFGVLGGSLSEGIDYANNVIKGIVIVGIPLEKPNLELTSKIEYINKVFNGKGTEYVYLIPAIIRSVQAAGRAIRSEKDRAFVILMDKRYNWGIYHSIIKEFITISKANNYLEAIIEFNKNYLKNNYQSSI